MAIPTFTTGYPPDGSSLGGTKAVIRDNLDGTFQAFSVEHYNQNTATPGLHGQSTYPNLPSADFATSPPLTIAGQQAIYSKNVTGGSALFTVRDGDNTTETQLTSAAFNAPVAATNGYTYLPGGLILQWGLATIAVGIQTPLLFATNNIAFPTNCFNVQITGLRTNSGSDNVFVLEASVSATGFTFRNNSGSITECYWVAIGN